MNYYEGTRIRGANFNRCLINSVLNIQNNPGAHQSFTADQRYLGGFRPNSIMTTREISPP